MKKLFNSLVGVTTIFLASLLVTPTQAQNTQYEVLIFARKPDNSSIPLPTDAGHAWIAIVRNDGNGQWQTDATYGFWPESRNEPSVNQGTDFDHTNRYLRGQPLSRRGQAVRKAKIGPNRANWIKNGAYREAGCASYQAFGGTGTSCNCADYATRLWWVLTARREDFRIRAITLNLTLDSLVDQINRQNSATGEFLDSGRTWE